MENVFVNMEIIERKKMYLEQTVKRPSKEQVQVLASEKPFLIDRK